MVMLIFISRLPDIDVKIKDTTIVVDVLEMLRFHTLYLAGPEIDNTHTLHNVVRKN
jgi:hypothetical protein